jgi:serine/threonine protein phosphatase PrpC
MNIEWGAACRPKQGQHISGDIYVVQETRNGQFLVGVIDGLGGGIEASQAATAAAEIVHANSDIPLSEIFRKVHVALRSTRGAVMALLRLENNQHKAEYTGVGNIGIQVHSNYSIKPISKNGILGYRLPSLLHLHYTFDVGDTFVLYSDGISSRFNLGNSIDLTLAPQSLADTILLQHGKTIDDVTVVVVRSF